MDPVPHHIGFFDGNGTIFALDKAGGKNSFAEVANDLLAKKTSYAFDKGKEPETYISYVNRTIPGNPDDPLVRKERAAKVNQFLHYIEEIDHPAKNQIQKQHSEIIEKLEASKLFRSFKKLIEKVNENMTIVIRTFGRDLREMVDLIGKEKFTLWGRFSKGQFSRLDPEKLEIDQDGKLCPSEDTIESDSDLIAELAKHRFVAIQDDYRFWADHKRSAQSAKPFPLGDDQFRTLFFDDCLDKANDQKSIVTPRPWKSIAELICEQRLFPVDTLSAVMDEDYFINKLQTTGALQA